MRMPSHRGKELAPPPMAADEDSTEVLRAWTTRKESGVNQVTLLTAWDDPFAWGMFLVDIARHVAKAYADGDASVEQRTLDRIHKGFVAEWHHPTDEPKRIA